MWSSLRQQTAHRGRTNNMPSQTCFQNNMLSKTCSVLRAFVLPGKALVKPRTRSYRAFPPPSPPTPLYIVFSITLILCFLPLGFAYMYTRDILLLYMLCGLVWAGLGSALGSDADVCQYFWRRRSVDACVHILRDESGHQGGFSGGGKLRV